MIIKSLTQKRWYICLLAFVLASCSASSSWVQVKKQALYDTVPNKQPKSINGFTALEVFTESLDNSVWVSPEKQCVTMAQERTTIHSGKAAIHLTWDKIEGGCKWLGIGFGWNDWQPKDMSALIDTASIQLKVRAAKGSFSNLPVAFAFEDYTGVQSYCGFNSKQASGQFSDKAWTVVTIPLKDFPFEQNDADLSKIKQFIIQLEADGDIFLDDIELVVNKKNK